MPTFPRIREPEWMDSPNVPASELARALAYIRRINRYLGYNRATRSRVQDWAREWKPDEPISILDVATGSGDVPADLLVNLNTPARLSITGLDFHHVTIQEAQRLLRGNPRFIPLQADAMQLPFATAGIDYALTSMFLHHLSEDEVVAVLREMWRVARRGVLAADLVRNRRALWGIRAFSCLSTPMIRHDAVVSVKQAFTPDEILHLCRQAGWTHPELRQHFAHRFTVVANKPPPA